MRASATVLAFVLLTGCGTFVEETTVATPAVPENRDASTADTPGTEAVVADAAPLPAPALDRATFATRLKEDFYFDSPDEADSITLSDSAEKDFILDNLALLPNLVEIEFSDVWLSEADYAKVAPFRNISTILFRRYDGVCLADLTSLPFITGVKLSGCRQIPLAELEGLQCPIRHVSLSGCPLDATGLKVLARIPALESLELSDIKGIDDDALALLANSSSLRSLAVYNCPAVKGDFLAKLKGLQELRELKFTGPLPADKALHLASFPKLRVVFLNSKKPLPEAWYQAIAENCRWLEQLELHYQALDKAKVDHLTSLGEMTSLKIYSNSEIADMSFSGPQVEAKAGAFANLGRLAKLETLHLSRGYRMNADDGTAIGSLPAIQHLELWYAHFEPGALAAFGRLPELAELSLYGCTGLDTADAEGIGGLKALEVLDLSQCSKASRADLSPLAGLSRLRELRLGGLRGLNDADMAMAQGMTSLAELTLESSPSVTDTGLAQWRHATGLRKIWLEKMNVNGTGFEQWPEDHPLEALSASGTAITAAGLKALSRLQTLSRLHVRTIQLFGGHIGVDLACFLDTPSLKSVALEGSYVTTQASLDKLTAARPELAVACRVEQ